MIMWKIWFISVLFGCMVVSVVTKETYYDTHESQLIGKLGISLVSRDKESSDCKILKNDENCFVELSYVQDFRTRSITPSHLRVGYLTNPKSQYDIVKIKMEYPKLSITNPLYETASKKNGEHVSIQVVGMLMDMVAGDDFWNLLDGSLVERSPLDFFQLEDTMQNDLSKVSVIENINWTFESKGCIPLPSRYHRYQDMWWGLYLRVLPFVGALPTYVRLNITSPSLSLHSGVDDHKTCLPTTHDVEEFRTSNGEYELGVVACEKKCTHYQECGRDDCGNDCGRGCFDGNVCNEVEHRCFKPLHPGSCLNSWILMQTGTDGNGSAYVPKQSDVIFTVGHGFDQSPSYSLPLTMHERNIRGVLDDGYSSGSFYFRPGCGHSGSHLSFFVFEVKQLTGLMITMRGTDESSFHWGTLDTILEIRHFDSYCSPIVDHITSDRSPSSSANWNFATGGWYDSYEEHGNVENEKLSYGKIKDELLTFRCNDDVDEIHGLGSRLESWLTPGKYVILIGGYSNLDKGPYELQVKSFASCLPNCGKKQCGKENNCETTCGFCKNTSSCNESTGFCVSNFTTIENAGVEQNVHSKVAIFRDNEHEDVYAFKSHNDVDDDDGEGHGSPLMLPDVFPFVPVPNDDVISNGALHFKWFEINNVSSDTFCKTTKLGNQGCFDGNIETNWHLMVHLRMSIFNKGQADFKMSNGRGKGKNWKESRSRCFENGGENRYEMGVVSLQIEIIRNTTMSKEFDELCNYVVLYASPLILSKFPIYDNTIVRARSNTSLYTASTSTHCKFFDPITIRGLSKECGFTSPDMNESPCAWYDITQSYENIMTFSQDEYWDIIENPSMVRIIINVNPFRWIDESNFDNNMLFLTIPIKSIPTRPIIV